MLFVKCTSLLFSEQELVPICNMNLQQFQTKRLEVLKSFIQYGAVAKSKWHKRGQESDACQEWQSQLLEQSIDISKYLMTQELAEDWNLLK